MRGESCANIAKYEIGCRGAVCSAFNNVSFLNGGSKPSPHDEDYISYCSH